VKNIKKIKKIFMNNHIYPKLSPATVPPQDRLPSPAFVLAPYNFICVLFTVGPTVFPLLPPLPSPFAFTKKRGTHI
jgi:hypothetical protein